MNFEAKYIYRKGLITPNGKTHLLIGLSCWYWLIQSFHLHVLLWSFIWVGVGALLPDCDHPKAPAGKVLPLWVVMRHRTWTHGFVGLLAFCIITLCIGDYLDACYVGFGYLTHLLLDSMTPSGVNWLYPYKRKAPTKR